MSEVIGFLWLVAWFFGALGGWGLRGIVEAGKRKQDELKYLPPFDEKERTNFIDSKTGEKTGEPALVHRCPKCHYGYCLNPSAAEDERLKYECVTCHGIWYTRPKNYVPDKVSDLLRASANPEADQ